MYNPLKKRLYKDSGAGNAAPAAQEEPVKDEGYQIPCLHPREYKENTLIKTGLHNRELIRSMRSDFQKLKEAPEPEITGYRPNYEYMFFAEEKSLLNSFTRRELKSSLSRERLLKKMQFAMLATAKDEDETDEDTLSTLYAKLERMSEDEFNDLVNYLPFNTSF